MTSLEKPEIQYWHPVDEQGRHRTAPFPIADIFAELRDFNEDVRPFSIHDGRELQVGLREAEEGQYWLALFQSCPSWVAKLNGDGRAVTELETSGNCLSEPI